MRLDLVTAKTVGGLVNRFRLGLIKQVYQNGTE